MNLTIREAIEVSELKPVSDNLFKRLEKEQDILNICCDGDTFKQFIYF
jgi:hypothetical protein